MPRLKSLIPDLDDEDQFQCKGLYLGGFSAEDISRDTGINLNTIKDWVKKGGWIALRQAIVSAELKRKPPEERPVGKMLAAQKKSFVERWTENTGKIAAEDAEHWAESMEPEDRLQAAQGIAALTKAHRANLGLDKEEQGERGHISLTFLGNPDAVKILQPSAPKQIEDTEQ